MIAQNDTTGASLTGPSYDVCVCVDGVSVNMLIDTGSVLSLFPEDFVKKHFDADRILTIESLGESHKFIMVMFFLILVLYLLLYHCPAQIGRYMHGFLLLHLTNTQPQFLEQTYWS